MFFSVVDRFAANVSAFFRPVVAQTSQRIWLDAWVYAVIVVYYAFGALLLFATDTQGYAAHALYVAQWTVVFLFIAPVSFIAFDGILLVHRLDKRRGLAARRVFSSQRLAALFSGLALMMALMTFQGTLTSIKNILPVLNHGFPHDRLHADIDAWLHFGRDPWLYLQGVMSNLWVLRVLEFNYGSLWFVVCYGALFFVATSPRVDDIRKRYICMYMIVWILCGNVLAGLFLSAGPAFYPLVTGDTERFAAQSAFLASGAWEGSASALQRYLWSLYEWKIAGFGSGISAFPSVHVALITMNALFLAEYSRRWGMIAFAYVGLICVSSVYLGWHYAIDGYVSIAVVTVCHLVVKRLMSPAEEEDASGVFAGTP